jgi:hypothetical protein
MTNEYPNDGDYEDFFSRSGKLKAINKKTGLPLSDIFRRAIDEYWERFERKIKK